VRLLVVLLLLITNLCGSLLVRVVAGDIRIQLANLLRKLLHLALRHLDVGLQLLDERISLADRLRLERRLVVAELLVR
jgi:hypothetical protein